MLTRRNAGNLKREHNDDINGAETLYKKALASEPSHIQANRSLKEPKKSLSRASVQS
jgi:hypothetical protein